MDHKDKIILRILLSRRRSLSAKKVTELLNESGIKISIPTVRKRLNRLKENEWVIGSYRFNPKRLPKKYQY